MKERLLTLTMFLLIGIVVFSQKIETPNKVIKSGPYTSYYSDKIEGPAYVVYKLYRGGGDVPRKGMTFKSDLPHYSYPHSGYDIGHLCNAEDFAYNRSLEESTFRYYNAVPMTPTLNRGKWSSYESKIRKLSQTDSLLIITGGCDYNGLIPGRCFKIVYSLSKGHKVYYSVIMDNKTCSDSIQIVNSNKLGEIFKYRDYAK